MIRTISSIRARTRVPLSGILAVLLLGPSPVRAQDLQRGQDLFQHHCLACHYDFQRPEVRHLQSLDELRKRISAWALHTNTGWSEEEVDDVLHYLNVSFYKFPKKTL